MRDVTLDSIRREIGIVFEDAFLFSDTVRTNIAYGRPDASDDDVERAARIAGAHEFVQELPLGYDTVVGERGLTLSGGQRQRISIARAVLTDPRILVLDDATSSVDTRTEEQIHATLREIMVDRTTVLIAHRRSTLRLADRIVADGTTGRPSRPAPTRSCWRRRPRYRALLPGPGDDLDDDGDAGRRQATDGCDRRDGITASLWVRDDADGSGGRARVRGPRRPGGGARGLGGSGSVGPRARVAASRSLPRPSSSPRSTPCPRPTTIPTSTSRPRPRRAKHFRLRGFLRPYRRPLLIGFGLIVVDTLLTLAGPFLVQQGLNNGVQEQADRRALARVGRSSSAPRSSTGSSPGPTRATPVAPPSGCSSRCASASSPTCNGSRSTTTTARWRAGS